MTGHAAFDSIRWVAAVCAIGSVVTSLEVLSIRQEHGDYGLYSWRLVRWQRDRTTGIASSFVTKLLHFAGYIRADGVTVLMLFRAAFSLLAVIGPPDRALLWFSCTVIALIIHFQTARTRLGRNGGDQMMAIVFTALSIGLSLPSPLAWSVTLWFLSAQLCVAYCTSGVVKASVRAWWDGTALRCVLRTTTYGHRGLWNMFRRHAVLCGLLSSVIIIFECTFPVVLFMPAPLRYAMVVAGVAFHIGNAGILGLNTFVWPYIGLYPAILFTSSCLT
jgi:hypothetical protein